ncbi:MAG: MerR family DNA-binding transcriptional regulator [Planctomycetes bacterium]|nr:MerR family DNA-binding transcriptional regulator [Planctomycetota bacterium]
MSRPKKLWGVGEVTQHTGLSRQTIHNYVVLGLIREVQRSPAGYRQFDASVFKRLARIDELKRKGKRLKEIVAIFNRQPDTRRRAVGRRGGT